MLNIVYLLLCFFAALLIGQQFGGYGINAGSEQGIIQSSGPYKELYDDPFMTLEAKPNWREIERKEREELNLIYSNPIASMNNTGIYDTFIDKYYQMAFASLEYVHAKIEPVYTKCVSESGRVSGTLIFELRRYASTLETIVMSLNQCKLSLIGCKQYHEANEFCFERTQEIFTPINVAFYKTMRDNLKVEKILRVTRWHFDTILVRIFKMTNFCASKHQFVLQDSPIKTSLTKRIDIKCGSIERILELHQNNGFYEIAEITKSEKNN